ncbi:helix-turn-helix transcriptional regulator [Salinisphaera japonica]|uniref:helix-turn-helix transcriptional regulator n=1 Tax=Salinisphaera japonica TaxID=1304270 RepID=UPI001C84DBE9|nr:WYL domain-containing protein [Salinisphaera japonica]
MSYHFDHVKGVRVKHSKMMVNSEDPRVAHLSRAQLQRLMAIDFRAYFLGQFSRAEIAERFGVAAVSVTRDIAYYRETLGGHIELEKRSKHYRPGKEFQPVFTHDPARALRTLSRGGNDGGWETGEALLIAEVPPRLSLPSTNILAAVSRSVFRRYPLRIQYHSFSSGCVEREIVPFALAFNGLRWHVRAFDRRREKFSDFVLTRIDTANAGTGGAIQDFECPEHDLEWNRVIELELAPHPKEEYPYIVAMDYGMRAGTLKVRVRAALAPYFLRQWIVDCSEHHLLDGAEYRLWLRNSPILYGISGAHLAPGYNAVDNQSSFNF